MTPQMACRIPSNRLADFLVAIDGRAKVISIFPVDYDYDVLLEQVVIAFQQEGLEEIQSEMRKPRLATQKQRDFMENLGLSGWNDPELTRQEAYLAIQEGLSMRV